MASGQQPCIRGRFLLLASLQCIKRGGRGARQYTCTCFCPKDCSAVQLNVSVAHRREEGGDNIIDFHNAQCQTAHTPLGLPSAPIVPLLCRNYICPIVGLPGRNCIWSQTKLASHEEMVYIYSSHFCLTCFTNELRLVYWSMCFSQMPASAPKAGKITPLRKHFLVLHQITADHVFI